MSYKVNMANNFAIGLCVNIHAVFGFYYAVRAGEQIRESAGCSMQAVQSVRLQ